MANQQDVKVTLYWLEQSRSQRILWLLEECGVKYDVEIFHRQSTKLAPPELKKVHPLGKSPVIGIQAPALKEPLILAESGFICEYLSDHFAKHLVPQKYPDGKDGEVGAETESWLRYRFYMHYAEGSLMPLLVVTLLTNSIKNGSPFFVKFITGAIAGKIEELYLEPNFKTHFSFLESQIATSPNGGQFLCGKDLTAADILMSFPLIASKSRAGLTSSAYPKLHAYVERLEAQEGYKRAITKIEELSGEPFKGEL